VVGRSRLSPGFELVATLFLVVGCSSAPSTAPSEAPTLAPGPTIQATALTTGAPVATAEPAGTNASPTETAAIATEPPPRVAGKWTAVSSDAVAAAQLLDVTWTGTQFIATGGALAGGGVFLRSDDGKTWKSGTAGGTTGGPYHIGSGPSGIVAIGDLDDKAASWHSTDGIHWEYHLKVFPKSLTADDLVGVNDVVATPSGWLAVGTDNQSCFVSCAPNPIRGLVWTSTDGLDWTRVANQASLSHGGLSTVVAVDGGYVAGGDSGGRAAFWTSPDGTAWTRVADDSSFGTKGTTAGVQVTGLAERGGTVVAVGMELTGGEDSATVVRAWRSADGRAWKEATVDKALGGQVFAVAATTTGFLATGPSGDPSCLGGIWSSSDGASWACEASRRGFKGFGPYAAAGSPTVDVAVGLTDAGCGEEDCPEGLPGAVWWRPVP
jgi:hypothetical protein